MDGSEFISSHADKYYTSIIGNDYSHYTKCHITIDAASGIILYTQAIKGPRHDIKFAIPATRDIKTIYNFLNQSLVNQKKIAITTDLNQNTVK